MKNEGATKPVGLAFCALTLALGGASVLNPASVAAQTVAVQTGSPSMGSEPLVLKRRIAIGRFSNSTRYGRALLLPGEPDPLADQAGDMLSARLVESGKFIVLERRDVETIRSEQAIAGGGTVVGADTILLGSVTQFGRKAEGKVGFLNAQARQVASATVEIRLVNTRTGQAYFSTTGTGTADVATKEVAGFGSQAAYDSTLNDKAISAAISDLMTNLLQKLQEKPWSTDVLAVHGSEVLVSGGPLEGLHVGQRLSVARHGAVVTSGQSGMPIELPSESIATIEVTGFFGSGDAEGARAVVISGQLGPSIADLVVTSIPT